MATFFSSSADRRDSGGDMLFHHYPASNPYSDSWTSGLVRLPDSTIVPQSHIAQGDGRTEAAIRSAAEGLMNSHEIGMQTQLLMLNDPSTASAMRHQGLSLSLGTQVPASLYRYCSTSIDTALLSPHQSMTVNRNALNSSAVQNSKYLKAARELLDEVVNFRDAIKRKTDKNKRQAATEFKDTDKGDDKASNAQESAGGSSSAELSPSERQDLQNKVTALLAMLDQVDRRYRHYHHQMQVVMSSFDEEAGPGAAMPYTALALQTISRHFRSLKDAISSQIQSARLSLGEPDTSVHGSGGGGIHRLRYIDQQLRQQRAAQQQAWRPQRGLPESSVSVLRAWLFEHFLHPLRAPRHCKSFSIAVCSAVLTIGVHVACRYPKDSEKLMLARRTGLTRGQVSNWFINARVRLWKPMIEEMYKEEFAAEMESHSSSENAGKGKDEACRSSEDRDEIMQSAGSHGQHNPFKSEAKALTAAVAGLSGIGGLLQDALAHHDGNARFLDYGGSMSELGGYGAGVSLTLGLQHRASGAAVQQGFYSNAGGFEYMNDGADEDRQRYGSTTSKLLHDFVA